MSLKKYSFLSIFCYGLIFISPLILASIGLVKSTSELITATAVMYISTLNLRVLTYIFNNTHSPSFLQAFKSKKRNFILTVAY